VFAGALLLLGLGALGHLLAQSSFEAILASSLVRGAGFGAATVSGAVLVAELAEAHQRGRAVGNLGLVVGLSSMVSPSLGLLLLGTHGEAAVWWYAGAVALFGVPIVYSLQTMPRTREGAEPVHQALRRRALAVPVAGLALLTATYGGLVSFAPRIMEPSGWGSAATFFLIYGGARAFTRWSGGHGADRFGYRRVLLGGMIAVLVGISLLPLSLHPLVVLLSGLLYGGGSGMAQSAIFVGMLERTTAGETRLVGTLWNLAFDAGVSLGGIVLGIVAANAGYRGVLLSMPVLTLLALALFRTAWPTGARSTPPQGLC
jgi:predicted MFS family arabinose efflux permease